MKIEIELTTEEKCKLWRKILLILKPKERKEVRCVWDLNNEG